MSSWDVDQAEYMQLRLAGEVAVQNEGVVTWPPARFPAAVDVRAAVSGFPFPAEVVVTAAPQRNEDARWRGILRAHRMLDFLRPDDFTDDRYCIWLGAVSVRQQLVWGGSH